MGHSNRRRTQQDDFEALEIYPPEIELQRQIGRIVQRL
jgi:restriction endonuclease S subunit